MGKKWLKCAAVRGIRTAAQIGVILIGSDMVNIVSLDWPYIVGCMASGFVAAMLTSLAGLPECKEEIEIERGDHAA